MAKHQPHNRTDRRYRDGSPRDRVSRSIENALLVFCETLMAVGCAWAFAVWVMFLWAHLF